MVPGEGTYTVAPDGTVTFVPEKDFIGTASGVLVVRVDTEGNLAYGAYIPTVLPTPSVPETPYTPSPTKPVTDKVLTTYVDENGELIIPDENGSHPGKGLEGYEIVRTETDDNGNVRNVYRKIQSQKPVQPVEPANPAMPEQPANSQVPATPAQPVQEAQATVSKETETKRELPNTGTESNASLAALGLLGVLSGFGLVARKKKED